MTDFPMPPEAMLSAQIDLSDPFRMVLGIIHPDGEPEPVVVIWNGEMFRRLSREAATKYADWIDEQSDGPALRPVSDALRSLVETIDGMVTKAMFARASKAAARAMKYGAVH